MITFMQWDEALRLLSRAETYPEAMAVMLRFLANIHRTEVETAVVFKEFEEGLAKWRQKQEQ